MAFTERSEATRTAILAAARRYLADAGYEGTTIRAVASAAGVDPSMVIRYYGSKAGLFRAAVDVSLGLADLAGHPVDELGQALARHFIARWEGDLADEAIGLLLRSAATNPVAAERVRDVFNEQILSLVGRVSASTDDAARRAAMISAHVLGIAFARYVVELPPMAAMGAETLIATLGPVLQHYLTGDLAERVHTQ
jgi:AcrR family transcriptional regulator